MSVDADRRPLDKEAKYLIEEIAKLGVLRLHLSS